MILQYPYNTPQHSLILLNKKRQKIIINKFQQFFFYYYLIVSLLSALTNQQRNIMEKLEVQKFHAEVNSFILSSFQENAHLCHQFEDYESALLSCDDTFYGRFNRALIISKNKIAELISTHIMQNTIKQPNILQSCFTNLTMPPQQFLNSGLLSLHVQLSQIPQKSLLDDKLISNITLAISPLLPFFFINKQYKKRIAKQNNGVSSLKDIIDITDENLLSEIEEEFKHEGIGKIFEKYLKQQERKLVNSTDFCRICQCEIKLRELEKHMKYCSKRAMLENQLKQIQEERHRLDEDALKIQMEMSLNFNIDASGEVNENNEKNMCFLKMLKQLRQCDDKCDGKMRRGVGKKGGLNFNELKKEIEAFGDSNELLLRFKENHERKITVKKKLMFLENHERKEGNSSNSDVCSLTSLSSSINNAFNTASVLKTKKSLFAVSRRSSSSDSKSEKQNMKESENGQKWHSDDKSKKSGASILRSLKSIEKMEYRDEGENFMSESKRETGGRKQAEQQLWKSMIQLSYEESLKNIECSMGLKDFEILKFLGKGAFGHVYLVRRPKTGDLYALKHIKIEADIDEKQFELIKNEHNIFKKIEGDHLIRAPFAFSENYGHFFVLQFMPGGDFSQLLNDEVYLEEEQAKFYLAQIALAIEHLHQCQIIHRDLKPQNLVLDKNGHIKLTDFGLSELKVQKKITKVRKQSNEIKGRVGREVNRRVALVNKANKAKIIGTPDYIAPEIINQTCVNNNSIDWWSFGVIAYEILIGCRPFAADTVEEVLSNIIEGKIQWPEIGTGDDMISPEAADLIKQLLNKNFQSRLGSGGLQQIKNHQFFAGLDWSSIRTQIPPITPKITDLQNLKLLPQDQNLRRQIQNSLANISRSTKSKKKSIKHELQDFIRYDILLEQTYVAVEQKLSCSVRKMNRLRTVAKSINREEERNDGNPLTKSSENIESKDKGQRKIRFALDNQDEDEE